MKLSREKLNAGVGNMAGKIKKLLGYRAGVLCLLTGILVGMGIQLGFTQGPLTPAANLRVRTDSNGYLIVTTGAYSASDGPLTNFGNIRLRTDSNGYLITTFGASGTTVYLADGSAAAPSLTFANATNLGLFQVSNSAIEFTSGGVAYAGFFADEWQMKSTSSFSFASGNIGTASDTKLFRDAGGTLALRNGVNAQTFNLYSTYTDSSNYEDIVFAANSGAAFQIYTRKSGSGTNRALQIGTSSTVAWNIDISGNWSDLGTHTLTTGLAVYPGTTTQANLAANSPTNGGVIYCSDCTIANPCAGGGSGAMAKRLNGVQVCN